MSWRTALSALARVALFAALFLLLFSALAVPAGAATRVYGVSPFAAQGGAMLTAALWAGWLLHVRLENRHPAELGFALGPRVGPELGWGLLIGVGMVAIVVLALLAGGWLRFATEPGDVAGVVFAWLTAALVLLLPAAAEEALFRGYGFQVLVRAFGAVPATIGASALFAWAHRSNPAVDGFALLNIFLAGVLLSAAYLKTGSLWLATMLHLGWNWGIAALADLPVSGLTFLETPAYEPVLAGPRWLTGGAFGPEGGLSGTLGFAVGLAALLWLGARSAAVRNEPMGEAE